MYLSPAAPRPSARSSRAVDYLSALAILGAATLVRLALDPLVHYQAIYVIYTGSLVLVAWKCGRDAALLGMVVAAFAANYLFASPRYEFVPHGEDWASMGVFGVVGGGVLWLVGRWKRAEDAVSQRAEELQAILQERPSRFARLQMGA